jgi:hypothetical protein
MKPEAFDPGDGWSSTSHPDGTLQVYIRDAQWKEALYIERVEGKNSRRKKWCIVSRNPPEKWGRAKYAPKIAGPFATLEGAQAAYLMLRAARNY